ncbi:DUF6879 family protein [Nocardia wallacei]|uniref:DUF6879 family protein n=1 Tax=Nocardia wallacei TaxID=480035 RepID=UPI00245805C5|nr:DUF6879 family protein [Nocardia wallacei]
MSRRITELQSPEIRSFLTGIRSSWFRLATLQRYDFDSEAEPMREYLRTGRIDNLPDTFLRVISGHAAAGRVLQRVFVVREPLGDYLRFALAAFEQCVEVGEDIRVLPVPAGPWPADLPEGFDYWLFDDTALWSMEFDADDRFVATQELTNPALLAQCRRWRDIAVARSVPLRAYLSRGAAAVCARTSSAPQ